MRYVPFGTSCVALIQVHAIAYISSGQTSRVKVETRAAMEFLLLEKMFLFHERTDVCNIFTKFLHLFYT